MEEQDITRMNQAIERDVLSNIRRGTWQNIPPVFVSCCEEALVSDKWIRKAFVLFLLGYVSMDFRKLLFSQESEHTKQMLLIRFQLFFDAFLKGWKVEGNELVQFQPSDSLYCRSFGWILWELRSYYLQL